ncbi:hypothetical protein BCEP4_70027 [Burkholderia cepacia]|nr:hypothetical protein BCEP4_70027 [Burkholderia cepacia]
MRQRSAPGMHSLRDALRVFYRIGEYRSARFTPPMFFATAQWNQFHCKRQFNNPQQYEFIARICMHTKSTAKHTPQGPPDKGASLRTDERSPSARYRLIAEQRSTATRADLTKSKGSIN